MRLAESGTAESKKIDSWITGTFDLVTQVAFPFGDGVRASQQQHVRVGQAFPRGRFRLQPPGQGA